MFKSHILFALPWNQILAVYASKGFDVTCHFLVILIFLGCLLIIMHILFGHHMQDFLRQNNTGKILWQVFGVDVATLCLFGIPEHEEIMWNSLKMAGLSVYVNWQSMYMLFVDIVRF